MRFGRNREGYFEIYKLFSKFKIADLEFSFEI